MRIPFAITAAALAGASLAAALGCSASAPTIGVPQTTPSYAGTTHPSDIPLSKSNTIIPDERGGSMPVPRFAGWSGRWTYPPNDAHGPTVFLTIVNSGLTNQFGAPTPPPSSLKRDVAPTNGAAARPHPLGFGGNSPILYLAAFVDGTKLLTFQAVTSPATLSSKFLVPGSAYSMYVYQSDALIGVLPLGNAKADHTLEFTTPLSGVAIGRKTPLFMEVVGPRG